jgi:hypothetical protein
LHTVYGEIQKSQFRAPMFHWFTAGKRKSAKVPDLSIYLYLFTTGQNAISCVQEKCDEKLPDEQTITLFFKCASTLIIIHSIQRIHLSYIDDY